MLLTVLLMSDEIINIIVMYVRGYSYSVSTFVSKSVRNPPTMVLFYNELYPSKQASCLFQLTCCCWLKLHIYNSVC